MCDRCQPGSWGRAFSTSGVTRKRQDPGLSRAVSPCRGRQHRFICYHPSACRRVAEELLMPRAGAEGTTVGAQSCRSLGAPRSTCLLSPPVILAVWFCLFPLLFRLVCERP